MVKQKVRLKITEVNRGRRRVVSSIRAVLQRERKERPRPSGTRSRSAKVYKGVVKGLTSYSAFVDIGGIDGMVHVSEAELEPHQEPS